MDVDRCLLPPEKLRFRCNPADFSFETTADIGECPINIIGQPRAQDALRLGLALRSEGYNVFVVGVVGSGRSTSVRRMLAEVDCGDQAPPDLVYVHNFEDPSQPSLLQFPAGAGHQFQQGMEDQVDRLGKMLPRLFESDRFREQRDAIVEETAGKQREEMKAFEAEIQAEGFALVQVQMGPVVRPELVPVIDGEPVEFEKLDAAAAKGEFPAEQFAQLREKHGELRGRMEAMIKGFRKLDRGLRKRLAKLDRELAKPLIEESIGDLREEFDAPGVSAYLDGVVEDMLEHLERFRDDGDGQPQPGPLGPPPEPAFEAFYEVNVVVDNSRTKGRPIIWETAPNYRNLFGIIERVRSGGGDWHSDHTRIRSGSMQRANGGFLVIDAMDVLTGPGVWGALKRSLRNRSVEILPVEPQFAYTGASLKPQPVPIDVRVVMIGTPHIYRVLFGMDEDFKKIFKVKAEFATRTGRSEQEIDNYVCFVHKKCTDDSLPPFHRDAVAGVIEHGVRLSGHFDHLTTRFGEIADVIRESGFWALKEGASVVEGRHVDHALDQRIRRVDLLAEMLRDRIADGSVLIDVDGDKVGQVNGLAVLDAGDHAFGLPSRITATAAVGRNGIIDIEREARMGGALHTKGMLILSGFLRSRFAQDKPLALSASLCFEQNYGGVDGDSASSTELYALLSCLSGVPIRQGIAVTGSVNQMGQVQSIGGVNEKIEGFFDVCSLLGLTQAQGVMIPATNVPQLMLRKDVVRAVEEGRFRIWAVETIEEGIEVLTGQSAGARDAEGRYPEGSVFARADARLSALAEQVVRFGPADSGLAT